jgi:hypothetical protein
MNPDPDETILVAQEIDVVIPGPDGAQLRRRIVKSWSSWLKFFETDLNVPHARERALALVVLCVGGMVVARSVDDQDLADDLLRAAHQHALVAGGWSGRQVA